NRYTHAVAPLGGMGDCRGRNDSCQSYRRAKRDRPRPKGVAPRLTALPSVVTDKDVDSGKCECDGSTELSDL
ncbi:MAG: hypothetical protein RLZ29_1136, partial [Actinomycetota bacterium]